MKMQRVILILALGLIRGIAISAEKVAPENLVIKGCQKRKPPVVLPHEAHVNNGIAPVEWTP